MPTSVMSATDSIGDKDMPAIITGEVHKYDLANSVWFKYSYLSSLALLLLIYWHYPRISGLWRQTYAERRKLTDGLAEFKHYLRLRIDVLKERKQCQPPGLSIGDMGYARKFYRHEIAYALVALSLVACTMAWKTHIAPPLSRGEIDLAFERANDVYIDFTLGKR